MQGTVLSSLYLFSLILSTFYKIDMTFHNSQVKSLNLREVKLHAYSHTAYKLLQMGLQIWTVSLSNPLILELYGFTISIESALDLNMYLRLKPQNKLSRIYRLFKNISKMLVIRKLGPANIYHVSSSCKIWSFKKFFWLLLVHDSMSVTGDELILIKDYIKYPISFTFLLNLIIFFCKYKFWTEH